MDAAGKLAPAPKAGELGLGDALARVRRRLPRSAPALLLYLAIGLVSVGWGLVRHPGSACACQGTADPASYMWALAWWPHALWHGLNPFVTKSVWAPVGGNVAKAAFIPAAAIALAPVTALFGPLVAYNVLTIAAPVLAAFTAYLLCRRVAGRELPAVAGGYLFGFGTYMFAQLTAHANLFLVFLLPVMAHLALRRAAGEISRRAYVLALAAVLVVQVGLSTEVTATAVIVGGLTLIAAWAFAPRGRRRAVAALLAETLGAGIIALAVASPLLYYAAFRGGFPSGPGSDDLYGTDLFNPVVPTPVTWIHGGAVFEGGHWAEADGYLSAPLVIAFFAWAIRGWRRFVVRLLAFVLLASFVVSLGSHLAIDGHQEVLTLPYNWVKNWPVVNFITPSRVMVYADLAVAVAMADWLAARGGRSALRWATVALGAILLFPNIPSGLWNAQPSNPSFFTTAAYRRYLAPGESALILPFGQIDNSMLWQAETGFYFRMPEGYLSDTTPPRFAALPATTQLESDDTVGVVELRTFLHTFGVGEIVVDFANGGPYPTELAKLRLPSQTVDGVILYRVPPAG